MIFIFLFLEYFFFTKTHCEESIVIMMCPCVSEHDSFQMVFLIEFTCDEYDADHCRQTCIYFRINRPTDKVFKPFSNNFVTDCILKIIKEMSYSISKVYFGTDPGISCLCLLPYDGVHGVRLYDLRRLN